MDGWNNSWMDRIVDGWNNSWKDGIAERFCLDLQTSPRRDMEIVHRRCGQLWKVQWNQKLIVELITTFKFCQGDPSRYTSVYSVFYEQG